MGFLKILGQILKKDFLLKEIFFLNEEEREGGGLGLVTMRIKSL